MDTPPTFTVGTVLRYRTWRMSRPRFYVVHAVQTLPVQHLDGSPPTASITRYTMRRCRRDGSLSTGNFVDESWSSLTVDDGWTATKVK